MFLIILLGMLYANYIVAKYIPPSFTYQQKKKFFYDLRHYFWDDPHLYKGVVGILDVVYLSMNRDKSYENVTPKLMEGIMLEIELLRYTTSNNTIYSFFIKVWVIPEVMS